MNAPIDIVRTSVRLPARLPVGVRARRRGSRASAIGRVHGAADQPYTAGVVCAKVARYAERIHHPDRLTQPLRRVGPKGSAQFAPIRWDEALDRVAEAFLKAEREHGAESVWPYFYAGTMGLVMRDGIERLTHAKRYRASSARSAPASPGPATSPAPAACPASDPHEMAKSDCVVIWGTNAVATQVNVMTHAIARAKGARREDRRHRHLPDRDDAAGRPRAALRPGTDGALACAVMHVLFRDGFADREYMAQYTDAPRGAGGACAARATPEWASAITGLPVAEIEAFAALVGATQAHVLPARLRLFAPAQRRGQHARGALHSRRHRRLGA